MDWKKIWSMKFVLLIKGKKVLVNKWINKIKYNSIGIYKAWLATKDFGQIHGEDFDKTFPTMTKMDLLLY